MRPFDRIRPPWWAQSVEAFRHHDICEWPWNRFFRQTQRSWISTLTQAQIATNKD
jgi:hypothetical protein